MTVALFAVAGYLAGSMPFGYWLVRVAKGVDIRTVGSGNIGATNVWRQYGRAYGLPVMALDILKGFAPALAATLVDGHLTGVVAGRRPREWSHSTGRTSAGCSRAPRAGPPSACAGAADLLLQRRHRQPGPLKSCGNPWFPHDPPPCVRRRLLRS